jgi:trehalose 2-sulfotransferase
MLIIEDDGSPGYGDGECVLRGGGGGSEVRTSYVICAVQRSGSFLLCEALKNTGLAGVPEEYFLCDAQGVWEDPDGWWARTHGVTTREAVLRKAFELGTTPNGVFGVKLMWNYFPYVLRNLRELPQYAGLAASETLRRLLGEPKYIWITRRDKVRQAVSWAIAMQTGVYAQHKGEVLSPKQELRFDFAVIDYLHTLILAGEAGWASFLATSGVEAFEVVYEDLAVAYEQTALAVLDYLGVAYPEKLAFDERRLQKQADGLNDAWAARYIRMKERSQ